MVVTAAADLPVDEKLNLLPCERVLDACLGSSSARRSANGIEGGQFGGR
jgi:hypothetical protein